MTLTVPLGDGSEIVVRQVRREDRPLIIEAFDRLSDESRFRRFLAPTPRLTSAHLRWIDELNRRDSDALIALDPASGRAVGIARYARTGPDVAEAAVSVTDDWHGRGVGTVLLELLAARAKEVGFRFFSALVLRSNRDMLDILGRLGGAEAVDAGAGTIEIKTELPPEGIHPDLRELLRLTARDQATVRGTSAADADVG